MGRLRWYCRMVPAVIASRIPMRSNLILGIIGLNRLDKPHFTQFKPEKNLVSF